MTLFTSRVEMHVVYWQTIGENNNAYDGPMGIELLQMKHQHNLTFLIVHHSQEITVTVREGLHRKWHWLIFALSLDV